MTEEEQTGVAKSSESWQEFWCTAACLPSSSCEFVRSRLKSSGSVTGFTKVYAFINKATWPAQNPWFHSLGKSTLSMSYDAIFWACLKNNYILKGEVAALLDLVFEHVPFHFHSTWSLDWVKWAKQVYLGLIRRWLRRLQILLRLNNFGQTA